MSSLKLMVIMTPSDKKDKWNIVENIIQNDKTILNLKYKNMTLKDYEKQYKRRQVYQKNITED